MPRVAASADRPSQLRGVFHGWTNLQLRSRAQSPNPKQRACTVYRELSTASEIVNTLQHAGLSLRQLKDTMQDLRVIRSDSTANRRPLKSRPPLVPVLRIFVVVFFPSGRAWPPSMSQPHSFGTLTL